MIDSIPATKPLARATLTLSRKRPEDTPSGCRDLAAADLRRATLAAGNAGWRYERSAAAWTARADMLTRHEAELETRFPGART